MREYTFSAERFAELMRLRKTNDGKLAYASFVHKCEYI